MLKVIQPKLNVLSLATIARRARDAILRNRRSIGDDDGRGIGDVGRARDLNRQVGAEIGNSRGGRGDRAAARPHKDRPSRRQR